MPRVPIGLALLWTLCCLGAVPRPASAAPATNWMWIWDTDQPHPPETVFFRQTFRLPRAPLSARLLITADDQFAAYVNGRAQPVAQGHDWTTVQEFDVTRLLHAGQNLLAVEATNTGGPGGLLYKLVLRLPGGRTLRVFSDGRVRVNRRVPPAWRALTVDDSRWPHAHELAPANGGVWGPLRGAPRPDPSRIVRLWDIQAGGAAGEDPYARPRSPGDRMLLSASVSSPSDMQILAGAGFTLFQTDSDHLSTEESAPNVWDWRTAEAQRRAVRALGLDWCYFPHYAFPPPWYRKSVPFTRIQCREHQQPVEAFSPWDPTWPTFIAHGYEALAKQYGPEGAKGGKRDGKSGAKAKVSALYVGVHGDYGEAGLLMGARVAVPGQREDWERRFGNLHDHLGWWCQDPQARASFRAAMLKKYGSLEALNAAWKRDYKAPEEIAFPERPRPEARREWLDYIAWYQGAVGRAVELNLSAARKRFPDTLLMLPAGFGDEDLRGGNDNSLIPKMAARYKAEVRSTHGAYKPFAENAATMLGRLGSACRFYGVPFWIEPPSSLTAEQEVERVFEAVSQGAKGYFDWTSNAVAFRDVYYRYGKYLRVEKPIVDVAMFYPSTYQRLHPERPYAPIFAQACAYLRDVMNFDIVDERMIQDGCLTPYRVLVMWEGDIAEQATLDKIRAWVQDGGVLVAYDFGKVKNVEGDTGWFSEMFGYAGELKPARVTERYVGRLPAQYRIAVGQPEAADYLGGEWYEPETQEGRAWRWTGANASVRLPVDPDRSYILVVRASVPSEVAQLKRTLLINGSPIGELESPGDVTYRFRVPADLLADHPLTTLTFQAETFQPAKLQTNSKDERRLGLRVQYVKLVATDADEAAEAVLPPGTIRRELDVSQLNKDWARLYGKGMTVYFPATRQLLKGYAEVVRRVVDHLSAIDPGRRDALPIDTDRDGVYATLFTDKILYYNSRDTAVTKTVTLPAAAFAAWRGQVAVPSETTWKLTLEPHSLAAIYLAPPPQELLFECEKFTNLGTGKPIGDAECSPGRGITCVRVPPGTAITTRFLIDQPGRYALYTRCLHNGKLEPVEVLVDNQPVAPINAKAGQTLLAGAVPLTRGTHTLTLRARPDHDLHADFILLTNDPTIAGYGFAVRTAPVE
ncbi:MAG TPA: hypothetical protein VFB38_27265 [Chthonomonadaceae bacterium]|nr:hypothetical protein [Chthonomonadaceae bacterium]